MAFAASLFTAAVVPFFQSMNERSVWRREQRLAVLQSAVDKALAAHELAERLAALRGDLHDGIMEDARALFRAEMALTRAKAGKPHQEIVQSHRARDVFARLYADAARLRTMLYDVSRTDGSPEPLKAFDRWVAALKDLGGTWDRLFRSRSSEWPALEQAKDEADMRQEEAADQLREATWALCTRAIERVHEYRGQ